MQESPSITSTCRLFVWTSLSPVAQWTVYWSSSRVSRSMHGSWLVKPQKVGSDSK